MRIAIINRHPSDVIGGSEVQSAGIAARLHARGHDVIFIAPAGQGGKDYNTDYTVIPLASNANAIAQAVIAQQPDIVYWRFNKYHFHDAVKRIAAHNIPIIFATSHINDTKQWSCREDMRRGLIPFLKGVKQGMLNVYNHCGFAYIDGVTVNNPDHFNILRIKNQCFVPNIVTQECVPFSWPRPYVVWVSNIKPAKRPELFVKLAKALSGKEVDFLMIGNLQSEDYRWLENETKATPNFYYLGAKTLEEVNGAIQDSLFLAHTCKPEGFPGVFIQAWQQAKPIVTYDFDPGNYIAQEGLGGAANQDWDRFVDMTAALIKDKNARDVAGHKARDFAANIFSETKATEILENFLKQILQK